MADRSVVYRLMANVSGFQAGMAQASASTKKLAGDLTASDKAAVKQRESLTKIGNVAGGIGLVAAAGLGAAIMKAADFDQSMSKVQAATHETADNMDELRQAALDAGAKTAFSATEAAAGIENLAKAGVSTQEILGGGLMGALDLAAAGEMEVSDAAEAAAGAMAQFKLSGEDVPHIADLLAAGAGKAQGEVSDMVMALKQGGTVASQTGLSIEETTGSLAAMAEQSLLGSDAGTSFKTMLSSLTPNSEKAARAMEEYNIHAFDAQGNFVGMTELAGQLRAGLGDLTAEQRSMALETIFGSDAVRAASIVYDNGAKGIQGWIDKVDDAGFAAETAAIKQDNLRGDLEKLGGSLETALIGTGEGSMGPLRQLVQGVEDVVNAYNKLPSGAQTAVAGVLGAGAALGGSIWVGSKIVNGISGARDAMENLGIEAGRTKGALKNIGAGVVGLTAIIVTADLAQMAIEKIADTKIDQGSLNRDLEALADNRVTDNLDNMFHTFQDIQNETEHDWNPLSWVSSWDPSGFDAAQENVKGIDDALAGLVESGNAETAAAAIENMGPAAHKAGLSTEELIALFPQYKTALDNTADSGDKAAGSNSKLAGSSRQAAHAMQALTGMSAEEAKALEEAHKQAVETGRAFFGLGDKVNKAKVSLGGWLRSLEKQREALRDFRINAQTAAKKGLDEGLIASLQEAGPEGALRMRQLAHATDAEIGRANRVWRAGQREIDRYADSVAHAPDANLNITVQSNAADIAAQTNAILDRIDDEIVEIHTVRTGAGGQGRGYSGGADGMTVMGDRYPYGDKVFAQLAPGEEVVSNRYGQADRHRGLLKAISANRYADGGTVHLSARPAAAAASVSLDGLKVTGFLSTPWGPAQIEGIARSAARDEIDASDQLYAEAGRAR